MCRTNVDINGVLPCQGGDSVGGFTSSVAERVGSSPWFQVSVNSRPWIHGSGEDIKTLVCHHSTIMESELMSTYRCNKNVEDAQSVRGLNVLKGANITPKVVSRWHIPS